MITINFFSRSNHDKHLKALNNEVKKKEHWKSFKGQKITSEHAYRSACIKLGFCFIRAENIGYSPIYTIGV